MAEQQYRSTTQEEHRQLIRYGILVDYVSYMHDLLTFQ